MLLNKYIYILFIKKAEHVVLQWGSCGVKLDKCSKTDHWPKTDGKKNYFFEQQIAVFFFFKVEKMSDFIPRDSLEALCSGQRASIAYERWFSETSRSSRFTLNLSRKESLEDMLKMFLVPQPQLSCCTLERYKSVKQRLYLFLCVVVVVEMIGRQPAAWRS